MLEKEPLDPLHWPSHNTVPARIYSDGDSDGQESKSESKSVVLKSSKGFPTSGPKGPQFVVIPILHPALPRISQPTTFIVEGHIQRPGLNVVFGVAKLGKSRFVQHLVLSLLLDRPFLGQFAVNDDAQRSHEVAPVLLVLAEEEAGEVRASLVAQCEGLGLTKEGILQIAPRVLACPPAAYRLFDEAGKPRPELHTLCAVIEAERPSVVVIDTISDVLGYAIENTSDSMRNVYSTLRQIAIEHHVGIVLIDHEGHPRMTKDGETLPTRRPKGSSQKINEANVLIRLERLSSSPDKNPREFLVEITSRRAPTRYRYLAFYGEDDDEQKFEFVSFEAGGSEATKLRESLEAIAAAEATKGGPLTVRELYSALKGRQQTKERRRDALAGEGLIENQKLPDAPARTSSSWTVTQEGREWLKEQA